MSYLWTDKITDYYYSNPELDTVAVMWTDPEDNLVREHYIKVDESDEQWRDFVKEVSYEDIDKRTQVRHEEFREQFREAFRNYAQANDQGNQNDLSENQNDANSAGGTEKPYEDVVIDFLSTYDKESPEQKEQLFKFKLKIFEQDIVKNSESIDKFKNAKTFIRKANSPIEVLLGYMVFTNGAEIKLSDGDKFDVEGVYIPLK
jgi:hypothetical protein